MVHTTYSPIGKDAMSIIQAVQESGEERRLIPQLRVVLVVGDDVHLETSPALKEEMITALDGWHVIVSVPFRQAPCATRRPSTPGEERSSQSKSISPSKDSNHLPGEVRQFSLFSWAVDPLRQLCGDNHQDQVVTIVTLPSHHHPMGFGLLVLQLSAIPRRSRLFAHFLVEMK